jgi:hypothetical protein
MFLDECGKNQGNFAKMLFDDYIEKNHQGKFRFSKADTSFIDSTACTHSQTHLIKTRLVKGASKGIYLIKNKKMYIFQFVIPYYRVF